MQENHNHPLKRIFLDLDTKNFLRGIQNLHNKKVSDLQDLIASQPQGKRFDYKTIY